MAAIGGMTGAPRTILPPVIRSIEEIFEMDRIWAPWRAHYIQSSAAAPPRADACFICAAAELPPENDPENLLVWRGQDALVMLNRYPYNNGHLLVAPTAHKGGLAELTEAELLAPVRTIRWLVGLLDRMLRPQGYNVGLNLGKSAGAGLPGHLHWHIVPRWDGDTNFMPVLGDTKVIVESLHDFERRLRSEIEQHPQP